jgi:hypothetical protein
MVPVMPQVPRRHVAVLAAGTVRLAIRGRDASASISHAMEIMVQNMMC